MQIEREQPVYFDGILDLVENKRSRETAISLDQMKKMNELMSTIQFNFGCPETTDIKKQLHNIIEDRNLKIPLSSLCSVLSMLHKRR